MIAAVGTRCSGARKGGGVFKRPGQRLHVFPLRPKCPSKESQSSGCAVAWMWIDLTT